VTGPLPPALQLLSNQLIRMQARIDRLERGQRTAQLDLSTIENGALAITDGTGTVRSVVGLQADGSFGHGSFSAPAPVSPSAPQVAPVINGLLIAWDGALSDGSAPLADLAGAQVHCSPSEGFIPSAATLQGVLPGAGLFGVTGLAPGTLYHVALVAFNTSGSLSAPSAQASGTPDSVVAHIPPGAIQAAQMSFVARDIGGITTSMQDGPPQGPQISDLWYDAANGYLLNQWNGSAWVPYQFGTNAIQAGSVTAELIAANTITAAQLAAGIVYATIVDGTTITGAQFIAYGANGEYLAYSGPPAAGNLISSVSGAPGTDAVGNNYLPGTTNYDKISGGYINATQLYDGQIVFSQAAAYDGAFTQVGSLSIITPGQLGFTVGALSLTGELFAEGPVSFGAVPAVLSTDASGYPAFTDNAGLPQQVSGSALAQASTADITTAGVASIGYLPVPAGDVEAGASFTGHASGSFSTGATVPSGCSFSVWWGGISGTQVAQLQVPVIPASAAGLSWFCDFELNWMTTSEAECTLTVGWRTGSGVSASAVWYVVGIASGLPTSGTENLSMAFSWGSAPGGQQLLCDVCRIGRVA
jgi:hypothetical protein